MLAVNLNSSRLFSGRMAAPVKSITIARTVATLPPRMAPMVPAAAAQQTQNEDKDTPIVQEAGMGPVDATPSRDQFWRKIPVWKDVSTDEFLSYKWGIKNTVQGELKLARFLEQVLPDEIPMTDVANGDSGKLVQTRDALVTDVVDGIKTATMSTRMTPYILSRINWADPRNDPVFRQFIPVKSRMLPDHPKLALDSLHEHADSPVSGLVHRYNDKALFLPTSVCPTYCMFCTRSYAVGADTDSVKKASMKPTKTRWEEALAYVERTPQLQDIVVSGGDAYYLQPEQLAYIGQRLIAMPNIKRFRFASKGLAVAPARILDDQDSWFQALKFVADEARKAGKAMALHTHFNHPHEISWVSELAARRLFESGIMVRNQTVLMRGVNDDTATMSALIRNLADNNIFPYYVYQCDMVEKVEHLRTPLQTILDLEAQIRGSIAGFMMPQFVVDLPGGGGKRLACSHLSYDRTTGVSRFMAPAVTGRDKENKVYEYYDPVDAVVAPNAGDQ
ncbi:hypothetical protein HMPREF1624_08036 [Sporothrix schenckii ATCC 58251]|uniref:KamA family protein n=1 Tax=Sporothrix schenckii (strain ATCC 58251 / de Perez 2211183) TaxID=1391915 RepID=U7PLY8_SPOS1|nr:hypothetical protein HMPREF1624_08036 [Sporothrix schenckii ATCC 58251]